MIVSPLKFGTEKQINDINMWSWFSFRVVKIVDYSYCLHIISLLLVFFSLTKICAEG